jgi:hypothetical protein
VHYIEDPGLVEEFFVAMASKSVPPIHQAAWDCLGAFRGCLDITQLYEFEDQMGRFKLWATNIEVFSSSRTSLDNRLKQSEKTRNMVLQLLRTLQMNLDYGTSRISIIRRKALRSEI